MNKALVKNGYRLKNLILSLTILCAAQAHAATYCGWIDDAKFGANLTDKSGIHSLSNTKDKKSDKKVVEIQESMKSWPSCGCVVGSLDKDGDFSTITTFKFKPINACKSDKSLEQR